MSGTGGMGGNMISSSSRFTSSGGMVGDGGMGGEPVAPSGCPCRVAGSSRREQNTFGVVLAGFIALALRRKRGV